jgi:uncharacterized protein with PIN domain
MQVAPWISAFLRSLIMGAPYGHSFTQVAQVGAVSPEQAELARAAYRRFGRGRHPAGLNFGDCFSYALSVATDEPLLFKGDDFSKTDIHTVELPSLGGR